MDNEPLWTVRRTACFFSVSETTVRAWQQAHLLPFLKIGGSIRFVPGEIRQWAAHGAVVPREGALRPESRPDPNGRARLRTLKESR